MNLRKAPLALIPSIVHEFDRRDLVSEAFLSARQALSAQAWKPFEVAGQITRVGVASGSLPGAEAFRAAFSESPVSRMRVDDFDIGYFSTRAKGSVDLLNQCNEYRLLTPKAVTVIESFLASIAAEIERICGHPWRTVSVRQFSLIPGAPSGRHTDGWPLAIKKLFILPNGATPATGSTWFRLRTGEEMTVDHPEPLWLIFENSIVEHSLITPERGSRPTIEVDFVPAEKTDTRLTDAGLNGWYPWFPTPEGLRQGTLAAVKTALFGRG